jgi:hypothetical protein
MVAEQQQVLGVLHLGAAGHTASKRKRLAVGLPELRHD